MPPWRRNELLAMSLTETMGTARHARAAAPSTVQPGARGRSTTGVRADRAHRAGAGGVLPMAGGADGVPPQPAGGPIANPAVNLTSSTATFQAQYNLPFTFHNVFIDADHNANTGYQVAGVGAD